MWIDFKRILCPTDLSSESDEALRYAIDLALPYEAKLFICHSQFEAESAQVFSSCFDRLGPCMGRGAVIFGLYRCFNVPN